MKVELKLFASLRQYMPEDKNHSDLIELREGSVIADLIEQSDIPADLCKIIFVNGLHAKKEDVLKHGDRVGIFPPIAGG